MKKCWNKTWPILSLLSCLAGWPQALAAGAPASNEMRDHGSFRRRVHRKAEALLPPGRSLAGKHGIPLPHRIKGRLPKYPGAALRKGLHGKVGILALVGTDGRVQNVQILESVPPEQGFATASRQAVHRWVYSPAVRSGRPIPAYVVIVVEFEPEEYQLKLKRQAILEHLQELARASIYPPGAAIAGEDGVIGATVLKQRAPIYPRRARLRKIEARVFLLLRIRSDGTVAEIPLAHADRTGYPFESAARRAALTWRFRPGSRDGNATEVYQWVHIDFTEHTARH